jgi:exopolyphosphatase/guanosine-5'-triphosphate,3'-diphosphate pyrophosphatase
MIRKAAIDIGANTARLLIADLRQRKTFKEVFSLQKITRLGEGLSNNKRLGNNAVDRTLKALTIYSECIKKYKCSKVIAVATSAVREALNGEEFVQRVKNKTGLCVKVISQEEEARLATVGIYLGLREKPKNAIIFDIGGGSSEYILTDNGPNPIKIVGLLMGIVHLTEKYIKSDPVSPLELQSLEKAVNKKLTRVKQEFNHIHNIPLIGTAGTLTQFAALDLNLYPYDPVVVNGHKMSFTAVQKIFSELKSKTILERRSIKAMECGREDLIIAGGVILLESMKIFDKDEVIISDFGLREGLLLD